RSSHTLLRYLSFIGQQYKNYNGPIYVLFDSNSTVGMYGREVPRVVIRSAMSGDVLYDSNLTTGYSATGAY
ncbi:hypothetical protein, partial [Bacteroides acidifaciens]